MAEQTGTLSASSDTFSGMGQKISEAHREVLDTFRDQWQILQDGPSAVDSFKRFVGAVDWSERWIVAILCFHFVLLSSLLIWRRNTMYHTTVFFCSST